MGDYKAFCGRPQDWTISTLLVVILGIRKTTPKQVSALAHTKNNSPLKSFLRKQSLNERLSQAE